MPSTIELELRALNDDEFEQLVFALVIHEFPDVDWRRVAPTPKRNLSSAHPFVRPWVRPWRRR